MGIKGKSIKVTFSNGEEWIIPASIVAASSAKYYSEEQGEEYEDAFAQAMHDDFELVDWVQNNMDWADFDGHRYQVGWPNAIDRDEEFTNAEMEVTVG